MAHDANNILGPITIKGSGPEVELLDLLTRFKGRNTRIQPGPRIELSDRNLTVVGFWPAAQYIEERYPEPVLMPETPPQRAITRSLVTQLLADPELVLKQLSEAYKLGPHTQFIFSDEPTLLDFAVACVAQSSSDWAPFATRVQALVDPVLRVDLRTESAPWEQRA